MCFKEFFNFYNMYNESSFECVVLFGISDMTSKLKFYVLKIKLM